MHFVAIVSVECFEVNGVIEPSVLRREEEAIRMMACLNLLGRERSEERRTQKSGL